MIPHPFAFDIQLFADDDDLTSQTPEQLIAIVKSTRKESAGLRSRITILETDKTKLAEERDAIKTERDTFVKEREDREAEDLKSQKKWEDLATKEREKREKAEKDANDRVKAAETKASEDLAARDRATIRSEARAAAVEAGIVDKDDVDLFGFDALKLEDGKVVGLDEWIGKAKEAKPHKFKAEGDPMRRTPPPPGPDPLRRQDGGKVDWNSLDDKDFAERERVLLAGIGRI